jgi:hypothetical protein
MGNDATDYSSSLELVIWLVPSLIGDAVAISVLGVLLGPIYPLCINHARRVLPERILTGSLGKDENQLYSVKRD